MGKHYHQTVIPISHDMLQDKQDCQEYIVQSKSDRDTWSAGLMDQLTDIKTFTSEQKSFFFWENEGHTHYQISPLIYSVNEMLKIFRKLLQDFF